MTAKLPKMSRAEEAEFWKTHDSADFMDEFEPVELIRTPKPDSHCSQCQKVMRSRYVNIETSLGRVVIRDLRELYCPDGHESRLSPEAQRLVDAIEAVLQLAASTRFASLPE